MDPRWNRSSAPSLLGPGKRLPCQMPWPTLGKWGITHTLWGGWEDGMKPSWPGRPQGGGCCSILGSLEDPLPTC